MKASVVCVLLLLGVSLAARQTRSQTTDPAFDVASIKPDDASSVLQINRVLRRPGALEAHATLRYLIGYAYSLEPYEPVKGESRLLDERFAVLARTEAVTDPARDYPRMVRRLLADRFHLKAHIESDQRTVSVIRRVSADTLGPNLRSAPECPTPSADTGAEPVAPRPIPCRAVGLVNGRIVTRSTMVSFARALSLFAMAPIVDETGLPGTYDVDVAFNPATLMAAPPIDDLPPFRDAMRRSLALKVDSERRPVRLLVVDEVSSPTPD